MAKKNTNTESTDVTEENTAPDAAAADQEVGETDVNFTTEAGTPEAPADSSDGTDSPSSDSTISPLLDATGDVGPLESGATGDSSGAPDASKSDTDSDAAQVTGGFDADAYDDASDAHKALKGEHVDGEGATHIGTDTPEKLVSNPFNEDTGRPLFEKECHSDEPLKPGCFDKKDDDAGAQAKLTEALELLGQVQAALP